VIITLVVCSTAY